MTTQEKILFLRERIEPISDQLYGDGYRASAYLKDGTFIPCVRFRNPKLKTELAINLSSTKKSVK